jgi:uncharacterized membrane protein
VLYQVSEEIDAAPELVWAVLVDVTAWPEWSATVRAARRLDQGPFGFDSRVRLRQPRLPKQVWRVTEFEPGRRFEWTTASPGIRIRADHLLEPLDGDRTRLSLALEPRGALAGLVNAVYGRLNRRYLRLEAACLKRRCETGEPAPPPQPAPPPPPPNPQPPPTKQQPPPTRT